MEITFVLLPQKALISDATIIPSSVLPRSNGLPDLDINKLLGLFFIIITNPQLPSNLPIAFFNALNGSFSFSR